MGKYKPCYPRVVHEPSPEALERALTFLIDCKLKREGKVRTSPVTFVKWTEEELEEQRRKKAEEQAASGS